MYREVPGDSGAWIVNAQNGDIYGHIVAGDTTSGLAYIIPAYKVFDDIRLRFGSRPLLPDPVASFQESRAPELARKPEGSSSPTNILEETRRSSQHAYQPSAEPTTSSSVTYSRANSRTEGDLSSSRRTPVLEKEEAASSSTSLSSRSTSSQSTRSQSIPSQSISQFIPSRSAPFGVPSFVVKLQGLGPNYKIQLERSTHDKHGFFIPQINERLFTQMMLSTSDGRVEECRR